MIWAPAVFAVTTDLTHEHATGTLSAADDGSALGEYIISGDFNLDSYQDVVISAIYTSSGEYTRNGTVYIINGGADQLITGDQAIIGTPDFVPDVVIQGTGNDARLGTTMAVCRLRSTIEDSLVIRDANGTIHIFYASSDTWGSMSSLNDAVQLTGISGTTLACGDIDGDGQDDIVFNDILSPRVLVIYGDHAGPDVDLSVAMLNLL